MYEDDWWDRLEAEQEQLFQNTAESAVRGYLGRYGDAIQERIAGRTEDANTLHAAGHATAALIAAVTAIEITVRFMLLRPLLQGSFLSEDWAEILGERFASGNRTNEDRALLKEVLKQWRVKDEMLRLGDGADLFGAIEMVVGLRNRIVHAGESAVLAQAARALECAKVLWNVVEELGKRLGFRIPGERWCDYSERIDATSAYKPYRAHDPF